MDEFYKKAVKYGLKKKADQVELFVLKGYTDVVQLEKNAIFAAESKTITGIGIRAYTKNGVGMATTSSLDHSAIKGVVSKAVTLSKLSPPDDLFESLPGPFDKYPKLDGLYDDAIENMPDDDLPEMAITAIDCALEKHDVIVMGNFKRLIVSESIYNSMGVETSQSFSSLTGVIFAKAEKKDDIATSWDYQKVRKMDEFSPETIGSEAAKNAVSLLGSKKIKGGELPVILDNIKKIISVKTVIPEPSSIFGSAPYSNNNSIKTQLSKLTSHEVRNKLKNINIWNIANAGINGINNIAESNIKFNQKQDSKGKTKEIQLETKYFAFNTPIKK